MNPLTLLTLPIGVSRRLLGDVAALAVFARQFDTYQRELLDRADRLIDVGESNVAAGTEMISLAKANIDGNRETNVALRALDARMAELLRLAAALEQELPALRASMETMESLSESASTLSDAAPPVQAAAARVERIAGRIPGLRGEP